MKDKSFACFWVTGYGQDMTVVTQMIGIEPSPHSMAIDRMPKLPKSICPTDSWKLYSPLDLSAHVNEHLTSLLRLLQPYAKGIRMAASVFKAGIICVLCYVEEEYEQSIYLSEETIRTLAGLGLSVDFDLQFGYEDEY